MYIVSGGQRIEVVSYSTEESIWDYAPVFRLVTMVKLPSSEWQLGETSYEFVVFSATVLGAGQYEYVSYPKGYWRLCQQLSSPVCGEYDIRTLCSALGLPFVTPHSPTSLSRHWWCFGSLRGRRLFDKLILGSGCSGGGCSTFHYLLDGTFCYTDLLALSSQSASFSFSGVAESYSDSREAEVSVVGEMDVCFDDSRGVGSYERYVFREGSSLGGIKTYMSNDEFEQYRIWVARNTYWRAFLRSRGFQFSGVQLYDGTLAVGSVCLYADGSAEGQPMICTGYTRSFTGTSPEISLECILMSDVS